MSVCAGVRRRRPMLLDLFCGAGGCSVGYARAGFVVVGVDAFPQPRYPFEFFQADAMTFPLDGFDAVHASPPCQRFSATRHSHGYDHPDLLTPMLRRLAELDVPWVVENVVGAPVPDAVEVCGAAFGLEATDLNGKTVVLRRHRLFGSNVALSVPPCACARYRELGVQVAGVYGNGGPENRRHGPRHLDSSRGGYTPVVSVRRALMGVDWMRKDELSQAIPPAYTEHIGRQLVASIEAAA